jgi:hypothetical protein
MNRLVFHFVSSFLVVAAGCGDIYSDPTGWAEAPPDDEPAKVPSPPGTTLPIPGRSGMTAKDAIVPCDTAPSPEYSACTDVGAVCEYGNSPDTRCNTTLACTVSDDGDPRWTHRPKADCKAQQCPQDGASDLDGTPCALAAEDGGATDDSEELLCAMDDAVCACTTGTDAAHAHERRWVCTKPASGCPTTRPRIGEACTVVMVCDYGACTSKQGRRMECRSGVWMPTSATCP